jgi:hypothetical protein
MQARAQTAVTGAQTAVTGMPTQETSAQTAAPITAASDDAATTA